MTKISVNKLQPARGYVLVEPAMKEAKTASGIILPTNESEKPQYGKILALGAEGDCCTQDCNCDCGCGCESKKSTGAKKADFKVGETVIYKKWGGNEVKIDEVEYQFLKYEDILAKVA